MDDKVNMDDVMARTVCFLAKSQIRYLLRYVLVVSSPPVY